MSLAQSRSAGELPVGSAVAALYWQDAAVSGFILVSALVCALAGRSALILALAVLPFPYLIHRPRAALWYGLAFIPVATVADPEAFEWFSGFTPKQMYFWAIGLFVVLIPVLLAVTRDLRPISWRRIKNAGIPTPLIALSVVSLAACVQGLRLGASLSFVLRQFYGIALFCLAFVATLLFVRRSDLHPALRRMSILVIGLSAYTILFYFRDQNQVGFFKGNMSVFSATLAVYCGGEALCAGEPREKARWGLFGLIFLVQPILFSSRGAVGLAGVAVLAGAGLSVRPKAAKYVMVGGAFAFLIASITMNLFAGLSHFLDRYSALSHLVPSNVLADPDAIGRISQLYAAIQAILPHPLLGLGLGSTLTWYQPALGVFQTAALVDNGWAYILSKMGLLGLGAFGWFAFWIFRRLGFPKKEGREFGLWLVALFQLLYMMIGGIMVHFEYAVWAGVTWGLLYQPHSTTLSTRRRGMRSLRPKAGQA